MPATQTAKMLQWLGLAALHPTEGLDRLLTVLDVKRDRVFAKKPEYTVVGLGAALHGIERVLGPISQTLQEELRQVQAEVGERLSLIHRAPMAHSHSADLTVASLCYLVSRKLRPATVIETGVAYGMTSSFLLEALHVNGIGQLHSIDLPPLGPHVDEYVGVLVREEVRRRWTLHRGTARRLLPSLLKEVDSVDVFVHDSLHTHRNISMELRAITPDLARPSVVLVDDAHENTAFQEWLDLTGPTFFSAVQEQSKSSVLGVAVFGPHELESGRENSSS